MKWNIQYLCSFSMSSLRAVYFKTKILNVFSAKKKKKATAFPQLLFSEWNLRWFLFPFNSTLHSRWIIALCLSVPWIGQNSQLWNTDFPHCCGTEPVKTKAVLELCHPETPEHLPKWTHSWNKTSTICIGLQLRLQNVSSAQLPPQGLWIPGLPSLVRGNNQIGVFVSQWFHFFNYFHEWKEARRI